ncbi:hypothetical protein [Aciditerrimonas ferrireducens]|uniref:hypothetical protein n=1 Tax=Aciditerrimonas ferrireducens TaxID=667306 RepID=UPI002006CCCD|nr:hypothetical protein [Aciditerrimonas ferrireducens]MCK4176097.1 hypothetical protein [Aciditerrimonas ferrireducens]
MLAALPELVERLPGGRPAGPIAERSTGQRGEPSGEPLLRHLAGCPACQEELARYRWLRRGLRGLRVAWAGGPSPSGWVEQVGAMEARVLAELRRRAARTRRRLFAAGASLSVVIAGAVVVRRGPGLVRHRRPPAEPAGWPDLLTSRIGPVRSVPAGRTTATGLRAVEGQ